MRKEFAKAIIDMGRSDPRIVFMTGDLGFMSLEEVRDVFGDRFINAGVSEQNMTTVAASLAYEGFIPFIYSISPFITLRPYEQIRNDICLHNLPVKIIANGGGYGYGIMGGSHHNIEDIGSMRILPNMKVFVPFTGTDVQSALDEMIQDKAPNYLRLNLASSQPDIPEFSQWRKIKSAESKPQIIIIGTGTVTDNLFKLSPAVIKEAEIWIVSRFPIDTIPDDLLENINGSRNLITIEEHQGQCGLHETLASLLLKKLSQSIQFNTLFASGYPSGRYGSQQWHQEENNLAGENLEKKIKEFTAINYAR